MMKQCREEVSRLLCVSQGGSTRVIVFDITHVIQGIVLSKIQHKISTLFGIHLNSTIGDTPHTLTTHKNYQIFKIIGVWANLWPIFISLQFQNNSHKGHIWMVPPLKNLIFSTFTSSSSKHRTLTDTYHVKLIAEERIFLSLCLPSKSLYNI